MREQVSRLDHVLRRLITLSALDAGAPLQREEVNLGDVAARVLDDFRVLAGARQLQLVRGDNATADVDPNQIREALGNLVDNAIRHTTPTGTITIAVGTRRPPPPPHRPAPPPAPPPPPPHPLPPPPPPPPRIPPRP